MEVQFGSTTDGELRAAQQWHLAGRLAEAEAAYRRIAARDPKHAEAAEHLGILAAQTGRNAEALGFLRRAVELRPDVAAWQVNLGLALEGGGQVAEAAACYRQAVQLEPAYADFHFKLGNALRVLGQAGEAIKEYRTCLARDRRHLGAWMNLGNMYKLGDEADAAVKCYGEALRLRPGDTDVLANLADAEMRRGAVFEAVECCRRAAGLRPGDAALHSHLLLCLNYDPRSTRQSLLAEAREWARRHGQTPAPPAPHANSREPERRLRVGYVSADYKDHPCAFFIAPLLAAHDRAQVEVYCYAELDAEDAFTERFRQLADAWRKTAGLTDAQAADMIRRDQIDILVDLKLHTMGNRLPVFAWKPAPIQVTWLGYPGTTGLGAIGYRLTDAFLDPPGEGEEFSAEKPVYLPDCFWCYDPCEGNLPVGALPARASGHVTFGCLNAGTKMGEQALGLWAEALKRTDGAELLVKAPAGSLRQRVLEFMAVRGVEGGRVHFVGNQGRRAYLETYHQIDIGLDTMPYNGHTTSFDALWMGVPVVTLAGQTSVGRGGLSQLMNLGLGELAAHTPEEYIRIATELAGDLSRLEALRSGLRGRLESSPLMDAPRFARNVEAIYRGIWRTWCAEG